MAASTRYLSPEHRRKLSEANRRVHARRRRIEAVRPEHVSRWLKSGKVPRELVPTLDARSAQVADMLEDLGGAEHVSEMQRATLETWERAMVVADVETLAYLTGDREGPEKILTALNTARSALVAVGLERRSRDVTPSLQEYLRQRASGSQPEGHTKDSGGLPSRWGQNGVTDAETVPAERPEGEAEARTPDGPAPARGAAGPGGPARPTTAAQARAGAAPGNGSTPEVQAGENAGESAPAGPHAPDGDDTRRCWCSAPVEPGAEACTGGHPQ